MNAFPLSWPEGWPRTLPVHRQPGRFGKRAAVSGSSWKQLQNLTVTLGVTRVLAELERMGIDRQDVIVSTNVRTRLDGFPRSGEREPTDSGAAVYWQERNGQKRVIAIDQYTKVADNLAAIAATLDALRSVERHGGARILERAFTGFTALPDPGKTTKRTWREVFGFAPKEPVNAGLLRTRYRHLAAEHHPDRGGSPALMAELNVAYEEAKKELFR
jgi:hypothetical protein